MLAGFYLMTMILGLVLIIVSTLGDVLGDALDGVFSGIDDVLENIGLDLLPDGVKDSPGLLNIRTISAFLAIFDASGWIATAYLGVSPLMSVILALAGGFFMAGIVATLIGLILKQQSSAHTVESDYLGVMGNVSSAVPLNGSGQGTFVIKQRVERLSIRKADGIPIAQDTTVMIIAQQGSVYLVEVFDETDA